MPQPAPLTPNNPRKRFDYVASTFEGTDRAVVIFDTALVTAHLVGLDRLNPRIMSLRTRYIGAVYGAVGGSARGRDDAPPGDWGPRRPADPAGASLALAELKVLMDKELPTHHRYEKLIPWAAAKLSGLLKEAEAGGDRGLATRMQDYFEQRDALVKYGTAVGQYVEAVGIDVGRLSIAQAIEAAKDFEHEEVGAERGEIVWRFADGFTVQRLTADRQLDEEGRAMQHCVGSYCAEVRRGDSLIYSLRDAKDRPHVTMEWSPKAGRWTQIKGKQNERPVAKYHPYLQTFLAGFTPPGAREPDAAMARRFEEREGGGTALLELADEYPELKLMAYVPDEEHGRLEPGEYIRTRELSDRDRDIRTALEHVVIVPYTGFSDDYGPLENESNYRSIRRDFAEHPDLHDTEFGLAVNARTDDGDLVEVVRGLLAYPLYDEDDESKLRHERTWEAWESWGQREFVDELKKLVGDEDARDVEDEVFDWLTEIGAIDGVFWDVDMDIEWDVDGGGMSASMNRAAAKVEPADVAGAVLGHKDHRRGTPLRSRQLRVLDQLQALLGLESLGPRDRVDSPVTADAERMDLILDALLRVLNPQLELPFPSTVRWKLPGEESLARKWLSAHTHRIEQWREQLERDSAACSDFCGLAAAWLTFRRYEASIAPSGLLLKRDGSVEVLGIRDMDDVVLNIHEQFEQLADAVAWSEPGEEGEGAQEATH